MLHVKRYFSALAVVLTMLGAYALAVAPWLEPPPPKRRASAALAGSVAPSPATQLDLQRLFPPGAWERDNPKIVEAGGCTVLVKDYTPTEDGMLKLDPCTIIFYTAPEGEAQRRPIVLQAPRGAVIQFDRKLDIPSATFGKLVGGRLPGEITIFSPATAPGASDALHLTTRNIQIDKQRVFTPHEVDLTYGDSHGRGRDLTIALLPKDPEDPGSGIGGVRSLTLARIERLHLETKGAGLLPELPGKGPGRKSAAREASVEVTCQGPFLFDVLTQTAMFDEGVVVERLNPGGPPDTLTCRQLLLMFADEESKPQEKPAASAPKTDAADPLAGRLKRLVALGGPVTLDAPSSATRASAARIEYSLVKRRLVLSPGEQAPQVSLSQAQSEFTARELEYELAEPGRLGRMWAAGPGELKVVQEGPRPLVAAMSAPLRQTIVARWDKHLRIQPDGQNQVISLVEKASISADPLGEFAADELHLWVLEVAREGEAPAEPRPAGKKKVAFTILPDRLLAAGRVTLDSPKLHVATSRLEAWFHNQPARPKRLPPIEPISPAAHLQTAELGPARPGDQPLGPPSLQKFDLAGDLIQMQVIRQGDEMELENLTIRGHVVLDELRTPEPDQKPIRITGDRLELRGGVTGPGKIDVAGQPAEVGGRGLSLFGSEIHVVRAENRLWIEGPGEAKLPAAELGDRGQGTEDRGQETGGGVGNALRGVPDRVQGSGFGVQGLVGAAKGSETIRVVWQERLTFDGLTADVTGDVQALTATQVATSKTLQVSLNRRIDFASPNSREQTDMARMAMDGGVSIISRVLGERGEQESIEQMQVKDLMIDRAAGTLHATGPGWVSSTRLASASILGAAAPGLGATPMPMPLQSADPGAPLKLNYIHIAFEGAIVGDLAKREIEFQRQVRTTFIPVSDWDERVEILRLEDLGEKGVLMTSQRLTVIEMTPPGQPRWIEASASGNAIVDGKSFKVSAPRIAYTSDKEVLTLEGDGRADAELWYQTVPGRPSSYGAARKWRYWLRTGLFDVEDAKPFEFQLYGIDKIRLPGRR